LYNAKVSEENQGVAFVNVCK